METKTTYTVAFSTSSRVWFAVRSEKYQGECNSFEAAQTKAVTLNKLLEQPPHG